MKINEVLLPKKYANKIKGLQTKIRSYAGKLVTPKLPKPQMRVLGKEVKSYFKKLKSLVKHLPIEESFHVIPETEDDFKAIKMMMDKPIYAILARYMLEDDINEDALNQELEILAELEPERDVRPLITKWIENNMPDQMYHFNGKPEVNMNWSPISGDR